MAFKLKNYSSDVPAEKSILMIRTLLIDFGARDIAERYSDTGKLTALHFILEIDGMRLPFKLPADVQAVFVWLKRNKMSRSQDKTILAQAERVAWKNCYEWLYQQLVTIELGQLETMEAFFNRFYNYSTDKTFYQQLKETNFKGLLDAPK